MSHESSAIMRAIAAAHYPCVSTVTYNGHDLFNLLFWIRHKQLFVRPVILFLVANTQADHCE